MGAVVEHHLGKAREVAIALFSEVDERNDGSASLPHAVCLSPPGDDSCAGLALLLGQWAEHLDAEPVTDVPVVNIALIEEARESEQVEAAAQRACWQKDLLKEEDAC